MLLVSSITLKKVEKFKYIKVVFSSDKGFNKETDKKIAKANAVLLEL